MKYFVTTKSQYKKGIITSLKEVSSLSELVDNTYFIDSDSGELHVKSDGTNDFSFEVYIDNVKVGEHIGFECDIKTIGVLSPHIYITETNGSYSMASGEGENRVLGLCTSKDEYEEVNVKTVYKGENTDKTISNVNPGRVLCRLAAIHGYGSYHFVVKNIRVTREANISDFPLSTNIAGGVLIFKNSTKQFSFATGYGHIDLDELATITHNVIDGVSNIVIKFKKPFKSKIICIPATLWQRGNPGAYDIRVNTVSTDTATLNIANMKNNTLVDASQLTVDLYCHLLFFAI